jgi:hypothetical protein
VPDQPLGDDEPARPGAPAEGSGQSTRPLADWLVAAYPRHRLGFLVLNAALTVANVVTGWPWWAFWPFLVTGFLLGLHYLIYKVRTTDDAWVAARVEDLHARSYDRGHIEVIQDNGRDELPGNRR